VFNPDLKIIIVTIKPDQSHKNGSTFFSPSGNFFRRESKKKVLICEVALLQKIIIIPVSFANGPNLI